MVYRITFLALIITSIGAAQNPVRIKMFVTSNEEITAASMAVLETRLSMYGVQDIIRKISPLRVSLEFTADYSEKNMNQIRYLVTHPGKMEMRFVWDGNNTPMIITRGEKYPFLELLGGSSCVGLISRISKEDRAKLDLVVNSPEVKDMLKDKYNDECEFLYSAFPDERGDFLFYMANKKSAFPQGFITGTTLEDDGMMILRFTFNNPGTVIDKFKEENEFGLLGCIMDNEVYCEIPFWHEKSEFNLAAFDAEDKAKLVLLNTMLNSGVLPVKFRIESIEPME